METLKIEKEVKFLDSINKWCVGLRCREYDIWTGGFFHKDLAKAEQAAMKSLKKSVDFKREFAKATEKSQLILAY